jgi:hypothetical protein
MSTYARTSRPRIPFDLEQALRDLLKRIRLPRASLIALIMVGALIAFESFNYGTTEYALTDLLGDLSFASVRWSTILALAFCGMDFAGIARLLSPQGNSRASMETWYLLGSWLLAATMNAVLTWWAVSLALISHRGLGNEILGREALLSSVPLFIAMLVWLIRVLMIGTFTLSSSNFVARSLLGGKARKQAHANRTAVEGPSTNPVRSIRPAPKASSIPTNGQRGPVVARSSNYSR